MKLSLSVRIAESFHDKTKLGMPLEQIAELAKDNGYHAVCMRASAAGIDTPPDQIHAISGLLDRLGLHTSMVTGDFAIPQNSPHGPDGLRNITPYLDLAEAFGCNLLRICMKTEQDILWAQRASDEAAERNIRLAHQCHTQSLFETVDGSLSVLERVDRPNFGIIYEPANLDTCGQDYGRDTVQAFAPYLFNVYVQNQLAHPDGKETATPWVGGVFRFDHIPLHDPRGIDWHRVFDALEAVGYDGYVTVHQALAEIMPPPEAVRVSASFLRSIATFED